MLRIATDGYWYNTHTEPRWEPSPNPVDDEFLIYKPPPSSVDDEILIYKPPPSFVDDEILIYKNPPISVDDEILTYKPPQLGKSTHQQPSQQPQQQPLQQPLHQLGTAAPKKTYPENIKHACTREKGEEGVGSVRGGGGRGGGTPSDAFQMILVK